MALKWNWTAARFCTIVRPPRSISTFSIDRILEEDAPPWGVPKKLIQVVEDDCSERRTASRGVESYGGSNLPGLQSNRPAVNGDGLGAGRSHANLVGACRY